MELVNLDGLMMVATVALVLVVGHRRLRLRTAVDGFVDGCRAMLIAISILLLAWSLSAVCGDLFTAPYLVEVCRGALSARLLPAVREQVDALITNMNWSGFYGKSWVLKPYSCLITTACDMKLGLNGVYNLQRT